MVPATAHETGKTLKIDAVDIQIRAELVASELIIDVLKQGSRIHRVSVKDPGERLEHAWLAELFAQEQRVELHGLAGEMNDYVDGLDIRQG